MSSLNATELQTPDWLNSGDNAWQLTASSLVALQSVPGLVVIYGALVKTKWAINSAFMCFYAFAMVMICWGVFAYQMSFGAGMIPGLVGIPRPILSSMSELKQANIPDANLTPHFPMATLVIFQFVFAAITLILIAGALLGRMNFKAWMLFVPLWLTFSYTIGAYVMWGGGWAFQRAVLDFAGGYVIHVSSGTAGFVAAYWVGPRLQRDRENFKPNNTLLALVGAGILWIGWNGFNGGAPLAAGPDTSAAILNTNLTTAVSVVVWTCLDMMFFKKPSVVGAIQGMITGLVAITPAAGFVAGWGAIIIGVFSGALPWFTMNFLGHRLSIFKMVDDTLGVFHTHLVAGFVGGFLVGIFATEEGCLAFAALSPGGAITGNGIQLGWQLAAFCFIVGWNVVVTSLICLFIKYVCRIDLRMSEEELLAGDDAVHGEAAYFLNDDPEVTSVMPTKYMDIEAAGSTGSRDNVEGEKVIV